MKIQLLFIQHIIKKNRKVYLCVVIATVMILFVVKLSVGIIMDLITNHFKHLYDQGYLNYNLKGVQFIFVILGIVYILLIYHREMLANCTSYQMFQALGATKKQMKLLVLIHSSSMILFTVPLIIILELMIYEKLLPVILKGQLRRMIMIKSFDISLNIVLLLIIFVVFHSMIMLKKMKVNGYK